jgi:hypothetical protein
VYADVLDQGGYVQYCYQNFLDPDINSSSFNSLNASPPKLDKKMMPYLQHAKQNCPKRAEDCEYRHFKDIIKAYLDSKHAGVTASKKAIHDKSKEKNKALNKVSSTRPSQIHANSEPGPTPTGQGYHHLSPTTLLFPCTILTTLPIITTISL